MNLRTQLEKMGQSKNLYSNAIGTIEIFEKKKFKIWCHMLGCNDSTDSWAGGWVMAYAKSVKASPTPLLNLA